VLEDGGDGAVLAKSKDDPGNVVWPVSVDQDPESVFTPSQHQFGHMSLIVADENAMVGYPKNVLVNAT
jgi:hypothetical protein